jgi:hypothetical protein
VPALRGRVAHANAFYRENASKGWQVVGLAVDQPSSVRKFLERLPLDFPVAMAGLGGTELGRSGQLTGGLPFTWCWGKGPCCIVKYK